MSWCDYRCQCLFSHGTAYNEEIFLVSFEMYPVFLRRLFGTWQMHQLEIGTEQDFKNHNDLPLARIKRIMKSDEDVRMISAEAPVLFAKACEMFILELTLRYVSQSCFHLAVLFASRRYP